MARRPRDNGGRRTQNVPRLWTGEEARAKAPSTTTRYSATGYADTHAATLLIVDNDFKVVSALAHALLLEGHEVLTAFSAESGLHAAHLSRVDVILVDLGMPLSSDVGLLRRLRAEEEHRGTPVGIITADYSFDDSLLNELHQLGATVAFKPLLLAELVGLTRMLFACECTVSG
jgi:DNA-binding NtrC family response regulator